MNPSRLRRLTLPFLLAATLVAPAPTFAQAAPTVTVVSLNVADADINTVFHLLERQTGIVFVVQDPPISQSHYHPVTAALRHATLNQALDVIAHSARATITYSPTGIYTITPAIGILGFVAPSPSKDTATAITPRMSWHMIFLQYASPSEVVHKMNWGQNDLVSSSPNKTMPSDDTPEQNLFSGKPETRKNPYPPGIDNIYANEVDKSLSVFATPDGYAAVKQIVSYLDVKPTYVQISTTILTAPASEVRRNLKECHGNAEETAKQLLAMLLAAGATGPNGVKPITSILTTPNNVPVTFPAVTLSIPYKITTTIVGGNGKPQPQQTEMSKLSLQVSARVNMDNTLTLLVEFVPDAPNALVEHNAETSSIPDQAPVVPCVRTISHSGTLYLADPPLGNMSSAVSHEVPHRPFPSPPSNPMETLIFITSTIMPDDTPAQVGTGQVNP